MGKFSLNPLDALIFKTKEYDDAKKHCDNVRYVPTRIMFAGNHMADARGETCFIYPKTYIFDSTPSTNLPNFCVERFLKLDIGPFSSSNTSYFTVEEAP